MDKQQLFRKKSLDRVSSPEQLGDYIRVSNPSLWVALIGIIVLLIGVCVWGALGRLETYAPGAVLADNGSIVCYVSEDNIDSVQTGMTVNVGDYTCTVQSVAAQPVAATGERFTEYLLYSGGFLEGEWVYEVTLHGDLPDGIYAAEIVVESVSPLSFVFN